MIEHVFDCKSKTVILRDITAEELAAMQEAAAQAEAEEKRRPLSLVEVQEMMVRQQINTLTVDDNMALRMAEFYPAWTAGQAYTETYKVQHGGKLWRCLQAHTSQTSWEPSTATASLWEEVCESHDGTLDDPIPYDGNMALEAGLYYVQDGVIYHCTRDTINPVYNALADLKGIYVEEA